MSTTTDIEWGYNCLTVGIHHGRPEKIWNLPLIHATWMFSEAELKELVISRIYNDAMMYVEHGEEPRLPKEWADRVKELAEEMYLRTLKVKVGEINRYYASPEWRNEVEGVIKRVENNKLNPHYEPLHPHDTINLLCRIIGSSCSRKASEEYPRKA
jgi:hypothetical protein